MFTNRNLLLYIDICFCVFILPLMILLLPIERWAINNPIFVYLFIGWLYLVYFINRKFTVEYFFKDRRHVLVALGIIAATIVVTYLITQIDIGMPRMMRGPRHLRGMGDQMLLRPMKFRQQQQGVWFLYMVVSAFSIAVSLLTVLHKQLMERQATESQKEKAELALYKAQINPHFLYNTLNTLYGLVITKSDKAEGAFMQFINLMKYMSETALLDKVLVEREISYVRQYIELQKNRLNEHTQILFSIRDDMRTPMAEIAPMILITFVENAIKYGSSSVTDSEIIIKVVMEDGWLYFTTQNPVLMRSSKEKSKGIGILNSRKRLDLLYPNNHTLVIAEENSTFSVSLKIKLV